MDTDGSGFITIAELGQALDICGIHLPGYQIRDIITQYDSKIQDNKLDLEEFKAVSIRIKRSISLLLMLLWILFCYVPFKCHPIQRDIYGFQKQWTKSVAQNYQKMFILMDYYDHHSTPWRRQQPASQHKSSSHFPNYQLY